MLPRDDGARAVDVGHDEGRRVDARPGPHRRSRAAGRGAVSSPPSPPTTRSAPALKVGDAGECRTREPAQRGALAFTAGERPANIAVRLEGRELVRLRGDDEAAERRPARLAVLAEQPLLPVCLGRPRRPRSRRVRGAVPPAGKAGRAQRGTARSTPTTSRIRSTTARPGGVASGQRDASSAAAATAITTPRSACASAAAPALAPRRRRRARRSRARVRARRRRREPSIRSSSSLTAAPSSSSSPRRSRELTVPRGRSSSPRDLAGRVAEQVAHARSPPAGRAGAAASAASTVAIDRRGRLRRRDVVRAARPRDVATASTGGVDRAVHDDPVEPGAERAAPVEAVEVADRGEKRLLRDVLGDARRRAPRGTPPGARAASGRGRAPRGPRLIHAVRRVPRRARPGLPAPPQDHTQGRPREVHDGDTCDEVVEVRGRGLTRRGPSPVKRRPSATFAGVSPPGDRPLRVWTSPGTPRVSPVMKRRELLAAAAVAPLALALPDPLRAEARAARPRSSSRPTSGPTSSRSTSRRGASSAA